MVRLVKHRISRIDNCRTIDFARLSGITSRVIDVRTKELDIVLTQQPLPWFAQEIYVPSGRRNP